MTFTITWLDGTTEVIHGRGFYDALNNAGYDGSIHWTKHTKNNEGKILMASWN